MLFKIFGLIDILAGLILMLSSLFTFSFLIYLIFGILLLAKSSLGLLKDFASWFDFIAGIISLILTITNLPTILLTIPGFLVFQKGIFCFLPS